jgi:adenylate cyclase
MVIQYKGELYPSLSLKAAEVYLGDESGSQISFKENRLEGVFIGEGFVPLDAFGLMRVRYLGPDETFPIISAADVLKKPLDDPAMIRALKDKIIFIGATAAALYDLRSTPLGFTAGVEIHANAAAGVLNRLTISKMGWQNMFDSALVIMIGLFLLIILQRVGVTFGVILSLTMLVGLIGFNFWMLRDQLVWLNSVTPAATIILGFISITTWQYVAEQESKKFITSAFGHYLSPKVINLIVDNPKLLKLGGDKRVMTAFFSDVAGFTNISEKLQPNQLVALLNEYLSEMSDIIHEQDGTVDKYEGDAIIAFWGAPIHVENHAELCVLSAMRQQRRLAELRAEWRKQGRDELQVRMGINTGPMVVGNMGSRERMDYTIMGDSVNLAARLEGANKYYGSELMVSQFTYELIKDRFLCRQLDLVRVQGKEDAIALYEVMEEASMITEGQRRFVQRFNQALATFRMMDFHMATSLFESCDRLLSGGDTACKLYIKRCAELIEAPPPEDWDRVYDIAK